jgi:DNA-directed RNA polymerase specialized sigma24 family protein
MAHLSLRENICRNYRIPSDRAVLMGRADLLARDDRDLVEAVMVHGQTAAALARISGRDADGLRRRVNRLCRRLASRRFLEAARLLPYLPAEDAEIVKLHFCQRLGHRRIAQATGLSVHAVRRRIDHLTAQIQTIRQLSSQRGGQLRLAPAQPVGSSSRSRGAAAPIPRRCPAGLSRRAGLQV